MERLSVKRPITVHTAAAATDVPVVFEGYASVFNVPIDARVPTIIEPGAFKNTLQEQSGRIVLLWQHDSDVPVGRPLELVEDHIGLYIKGRLSTTPRAIEAGTLLKDGTLTELSIGFDPIRHFMDGEIRHLTEVRLWEISLVTFAASREACVSAVHSGGPRTVDQQIAALAEALAGVTHRIAATQLLDVQLAHLDALARRVRP